MNSNQFIQKLTGLEIRSISKTVSLLEDGATVPFIARYRKEQTGNLDEVDIRKIQGAFQAFQDLVKRKETIIKAIEEQALMTTALKAKINETWDATVLEDLYLPYKKKAKTKATVARDQGLEPLAKMVMAQRHNDIVQQAKRYVRGPVKSVEDAFQGAQYIIAEWINENTRIRDIVRDSFKKYASLSSKVIAKKKDDAVKYKDYFDYTEHIKKIPSHRVLAVFRGEKEKLLRVKLGVDNDRLQKRIEGFYIKGFSMSEEYIIEAIKDSLKRLLIPSIENEFRKIIKDRADDEAIQVFSDNLKELLLAAPLGAQSILALDPGYRTGCKLVCLNKQGELIYNSTIYPHPPQSKLQESADTLQRLVSKYQIEAIAIGNGTAGKETMAWVKSIKFDQSPEIYMVNESGASIYSASDVAREEFPDHDITVRGAVSIGRRLADPLSELVKIDAKSIGVGQYQHDVNQKKLKENLDHTVLSCVNRVGINLNTASQYVLTYISGLGPTLAKNIVDYRQHEGAFTSVKQLMKVPRMGKKAFEQSAGFLRIRDGKTPLDNTGVHPERYALVETMAKDQGHELKSLIANGDLLRSIPLKKYISDDVGIPTLQDIIKELQKPGLDPRGAAQVFSFAEGVQSIQDIRSGMIVPGIVNNVTKFGAFVDIGIKESGLIHVSQMADRYISDPAEVVKVNQKVMVRVMDIDLARKRIGLSMKDV